MGALRAGLGGVPGLQNQSTAQTIKGSLRFDGSNDYLSRTFGSGNTNTWTWSGWVKKCFTAETAVPSGDGIRGIFTARSSGTNYAQLSVGASGGNYKNYIRFLERDGGGVVSFLETTQVFRDPSSWFHLVLVWDSSSGSSGDRVRLYVNGVRVTSFSTATYPTSSANSVHNTAIAHNLGYDAEGTAYLDGYLSNITFIDGQSLGPGFFGFTDSLTGTWRPKRLRDGAPTVNNGTDWAANYTGDVNPGLNVNNLWDGSTSTYVNNVWGSTPLEYTLPPVHFETLEIYGSSNGGGSNYIKVNGVTVTKQFNQSATNGWTTITGVKSPLRTITTYTQSSGDYNSIYAVRVDGVIMVRNTTTNVNFGTNGFYLPLDDQDDYTTDRSGKGNNWTANGFTGDFSNPDVVPDSPSGVVGSTKPTSGITTTSSITKPTNYCTWSPIDRAQGTSSPDAIGTLSNGNLKATSSSGWTQTRGTFYLTSGKWYYEYTIDSTGAFPSIIGYVGAYYTGGGGPRRAYKVDTNVFTYDINGTENTQSYGSGGATNGDVIGVMLDLDNGTIGFSKNGTDLGIARSDMLTNIPYSGWTPYVGLNGANGTANFGQRPFKFAPPDGYLTICSANARPSTVVTRPNEYVGVTTYTGTFGGGTIKDENISFTPDLVWVKRKNATEDHKLYDTVRGSSGGNFYNLESNTTAASSTESGAITSMIRGGFVSTGGGHVNSDGQPFVAWMWKAGGGNSTGSSGTEFWKDGVQYASAAAAGLTTGTITGASVGTKQGFSIIKYTGNNSGSSTQNISHGLGKKPQLMFVKQTSLGVQNWHVYHTSLTATGYLYLNTSAADSGAIDGWNNTEPTSSVFTVGTGNAVNQDGESHIAYVWAEIPGLSKFGKFKGNGIADGPVIELGFRPALIIIKNSGAGGNWRIYDTSRNSYNLVNLNLYPDENWVEAAESTNVLDILSNGFKIRGNGGSINGADEDHVYAAWAEAPSFNLYGGQANAR